jgi:hypothetical protein
VTRRQRLRRAELGRCKECGSLPRRIAAQRAEPLDAFALSARISRVSRRCFEDHCARRRRHLPNWGRTSACIGGRLSKGDDGGRLGPLELQGYVVWGSA